MFHNLIIVSVFAILARASAAAFNATLGAAPVTVSTLDVPKYLGLWYQMYADAIVYSSFEKDSFCATALYGDNGDGTLSVHNYAATGTPSGAPYVINGYAYQTNPTEQPGQLNVHFDSSDAFPFDAPYWVLELGPVNSNGQYDYAIVSDNFSLYLFVLARDPKTFKVKYEKDVLATLQTLGFTGLKKPIATYQDSDCVYESTIRQKQIKETAAKAAQAEK